MLPCRLLKSLLGFGASNDILFKQVDTGLAIASTTGYLPGQHLCVAIIAVNSGPYRYIPQPLKLIIQRGRFSVVRRCLRYGVYTWGKVLPIYHRPQCVVGAFVVVRLYGSAARFCSVTACN